MREVLLSGCALLQREFRGFCSRVGTESRPYISFAKQAQPADENTIQTKLPPLFAAVSGISYVTYLPLASVVPSNLPTRGAPTERAPRSWEKFGGGRRAQPATLLVTFVV